MELSFEMAAAFIIQGGCTVEGSMNIFITSVGRRTKLLEYFKKELEGKGRLIAGDCSKLAPALYTADKHYIVPRIDHPEYIDCIMNICRQENIKGILSLIDPELSILAKHHQDFISIGVVPIVSDYKTCQLFLDKYAAYKFFCKNGIKTAKTYVSAEEFEKALHDRILDFPVIVKPRYGSASIGVMAAQSSEEINLIFERQEDMLIQEYMNGQELGLDAYIDMHTGELAAFFVKEKLAMRSGETDKARTIKCNGLMEAIKPLFLSANLRGPIDMDIFFSNGEYYVSEVNPRFGGGYPMAYECGINFPRYIINNLEGRANHFCIMEYQESVCMMKHDGLTIMRFRP